jgi:hypothetical protein
MAKRWSTHAKAAKSAKGERRVLTERWEREKWGKEI